MSDLAVVVRLQWRLYAWAAVVVAVMLAVSLLPAVFVLAAIPPLDWAMGNYHRVKDGAS